MPKPFTWAGDYRSGRGVAVPGPLDKWIDKDSLGDLPQQTPRTGQTGSPSSSFSVTASQLMQQGYADDEIEYWADAAFDPPYDLEGDDAMGQDRFYVREVMLRKYIRQVLESIIIGEYEEEEEDEEEVEEASSLGGGSIRGYITPLGTGGNDDQDERLDVAEKSFGGGKIKN